MRPTKERECSNTVDSHEWKKEITEERKNSEGERDRDEQRLREIGKMVARSANDIISFIFCLDLLQLAFSKFIFK